MATEFLRLPVVSEGAEHLVMGMLMRRNILTYKAPFGNEGYDLICIHPDPRRPRQPGEPNQVRVQVKSRYATDSSLSFPVRDKTLDAFDFVIVVFMNIGKFKRRGGHDGTGGELPPDYYTLPASFVRERHKTSGGWQKVSLRGLDEKVLGPYRGDAGFEQIAAVLGVDRPRRPAREPEEPLADDLQDED